MEKSRIKWDNADFKKIKLFFEVHNPFDPEESDLRNSFRRLTAKTDDQIEFDQTEEIGKIMNEKLEEYHSLTHQLRENNKLSH